MPDDFVPPHLLTPVLLLLSNALPHHLTNLLELPGFPPSATWWLHSLSLFSINIVFYSSYPSPLSLLCQSVSLTLWSSMKVLRSRYFVGSEAYLVKPVLIGRCKLGSHPGGQCNSFQCVCTCSKGSKGQLYNSISITDLNARHHLAMDFQDRILWRLACYDATSWSCSETGAVLKGNTPQLFASVWSCHFSAFSSFWARTGRINHKRLPGSKFYCPWQMWWGVHELILWH